MPTERAMATNYWPEQMLTSGSQTNQPHGIQLLIKNVAKNNIPSTAMAERMRLQIGHEIHGIKVELLAIVDCEVQDEGVHHFAQRQ